MGARALTTTTFPTRSNDPLLVIREFGKANNRDFVCLFVCFSPALIKCHSPGSETWFFGAVLIVQVRLYRFSFIIISSVCDCLNNRLRYMFLILQIFTI